MNTHSVGKTIANLRKSKGWTQVELAEKLSVSDKAVSKWESEAGLPDISQLPVLAKLFGVSIDLLMTGKENEKVYETISKAELCAKTDDIKLAEEVKDLPSDENNKNIVDYILQYQSLNVFKKLCEIDSNFIQRFKILDAINLSVLSNSLCLLSGKCFRIDGMSRFDFENENEIKSLLSIEDKPHFREYQNKAVCILPRDFFTMLVVDKRINEQTLSTLLSFQNGRQCVWYHAFPYMIDEAYKNGNNELLRRLIDITKDNNKNGYEIIKTEKHNYGFNYFFVSYGYGKSGHGFVRILESTIKTALEKGDFNLADELNKINKEVVAFIESKFYRVFNGTFKCYVASEDEIRVAKLKLDKSISEEELQVQSAIHNEIICIDELLKVKDFKTIKSALEKYPIHQLELLYNLLKENKNRELFKKAVDSKDTELAKYIVKNRKEEIIVRLFSCYKNTKGINDNHLYCVENGRNMYFCNNRGGLYCDVKNIDMFMEKLCLCKQRIINEASLKFDKEKLVGELTKEYFEGELAKGNTDIVIIKLCVRLEAILRSDYHYEGDFSEMLSKYCSKELTWQEDDGWDYVWKSDEKTINLLNSLRKKRNSLVHSEKTDVTLTTEDIKFCIDYICKLG